MSIFKDKGMCAEGNVLSYGEFHKRSGWHNFDITPEAREIIIAKAEEYLECEIPMITLSDFHDFFVSGSRDRYVKPHIRRRDMLMYFTLAEHIEGNGRFLSKLCDALWAILEETTWVIPAHNGHNPTSFGMEYPPVFNETDLHGVDLYAANTGCALAMTLLYMKDKLNALSHIFVDRIEYELEKRIIRPFISHHASYTGEYGNKCNNWVTHVVECVLYVIAVAEKRDRIRTAAVARSMKYLENYLKWMPEDGGCDEGPGYWNGAAASFFTAIEEIYDMTGGAVDVFDAPIVKAMGEYIYKFNINGKKYINFADCSPNVNADGFLIARYGERCGSEGMVAFGKMIAAAGGYHIGHSHSYRMYKALTVSPPTDAEVTKAEKYVWYPDLKVMIARESEDTSKGLFLAIKGGHNKQSHNHNDVGSFIVYKNGNPVLIDPGNVKYTRDVFGPNRYKIWAMQSHYHNLPAFDGLGEPQGQVYASSRESYDPETHTLSLGLEGAFDRSAEILSYTRTAQLSDGVITVGEDIKLAKEMEIDFRLMTAVMPEVIGEGRILLAEGVTLEYDTRLTYTPEEIETPGADSLEKWGREKLIRMHFSIRAKELNCEFKLK